MHKEAFKYRREIAEGLLLYLLIQVSQLQFITTQVNSYAALIGTGVVYLIIISFLTYIRYSRRKVSKFSDAVMKMRIKNRLGLYLFMPILLFVSAMTFLYFNQNLLLKELMVILTSLLLMINLINIRKSYEQSHVMQKSTLVVFNFIDILTYYFVAAVSFYLIEDPFYRAIILSITLILILLYITRLHSHISLFAVVMVLISAFIVFGISLMSSDLNLFRYPLVQTILFYLIISFWHLRLSGHLKFEEYITPTLFTVMSLVIIFGI